MIEPTAEIENTESERDVDPECSADDHSTSSLDSQHYLLEMLHSTSESDVDSSKESNLESSSSSFSCSDLFGVDVDAAPTPHSLKTYKIVGDNIDKNIKPSACDMRSDHQTKSLHYYHAYAVRDQIDLTNFEDSPSQPKCEDIDVEGLLPSAQDDQDIRANFGFLVARVLQKYMPFFKNFGKGTGRRLRHEYSCEMGQKSEVVSIGIAIVTLLHIKV